MQRRGAAGDHDVLAGRGRAPHEAARLALGLGRDAAGVHDDDVGRLTGRDRLEAGGGEAREGVLPVGLTDLAADEAGGDLRHARLVRCSVSQVPSSTRAVSANPGNAASASSGLLDEQAGEQQLGRRAAGVPGPPRHRSPALRQPQDRTKRDVGHHDVGLGQRIRGVGGVADQEGRRETVHRRVARGRVDGDGVDVDARHRREAQPQGGERRPRRSPSRGRAASPA